MDSGTEDRLRKIWRQTVVPVIYRQGKGKPLLIKLPYDSENKAWLQDGRRRKPKWNPQFKCWETPKAWFNDIVNRCLKAFGSVHIVQPYREQEKCAPACWNATGHECQCSCMGANHGSNSSGSKWLVVSDAFATRWHERELACRLMTRSGEYGIS